MERQSRYLSHRSHPLTKLGKYSDKFQMYRIDSSYFLFALANLLICNQPSFSQETAAAIQASTQCITHSIRKSARGLESGTSHRSIPTLTLEEFEALTPTLLDGYAGKEIVVRGSTHITSLPQRFHRVAELPAVEHRLLRRLLFLSGYSDPSLQGKPYLEVIEEHFQKQNDLLLTKANAIADKLEIGNPPRKREDWEEFGDELALSMADLVPMLQDYQAGARILDHPEKSSLMQIMDPNLSAIKNRIPETEVDRHSAIRVIKELNEYGIKLQQSEHNIAILTDEIKSWRKTKFNAVLPKGTFREIGAIRIQLTSGKNLIVLTTSNRPTEISTARIYSSLLRIEKMIRPSERIEQIDFYHTHPNAPLLSATDGETSGYLYDLVQKAFGPRVRFRMHVSTFWKGKPVDFRIEKP